MINLRYNNGRINSAETPFKIPDTWLWVKLGDIADLYTGDSIPELVKNMSSRMVETGYDYIGTKDVGFDNMIAYNNGVKIPYDEKGFKYAYDTSILLCIEGGSAGRKIGKLKTKVCFGNKLCAITPFGFDNSYLYYFLQSDFFRFMFNEQNSGIIGGVSIKKMFELSIPLPPLAEQKRIVEKIEELEPLINRYGKASEELARIKSAFPEDLRNSILQQAVEGKLVPQNPADEPAGELLKRIKQERQQQIKEGKIIVKDIDVNGTQSLIELLKQDTKVVTIFLRVPKSELQKRLESRIDKPSPKEIQLRLNRFDFEESKIGVYDYVIKNNDLEKTVSIIQKIIEEEAKVEEPEF